MGRHAGLRALALGLFAAVTLALAGCGQGGEGIGQQVRGDREGPQLSARDKDAKRAGVGSPRDFEFLRYTLDMSQDLPRACLAFSSTLDDKKDYAPFVSIAPSTPLTLTVDGQNLCVGGLTFGEERELTIRSGFPALDGKTLAFDETIPIEFGDRPAYLGFKGDGVILPRVQADGLAIETVNIDKVQVTVSRITDRALAFKAITAGYSVGRGQYGWMDYNSEPFDVAERVWTGEMDTPGSTNVATTTVFPISTTIQRLKPGAYFVELDELGSDGNVPNDGAKAKRWLIITDLALTTYTGADGLAATARSIQTAKPMRGVTMEVVARNNEILARGVSDENGQVRFVEAALKGEGAMSPRMVMAYSANGDFALLDLDRSPIDLTMQDIGGRDPSLQADAYVYLDRAIYRPGETVQINSLLRDGSARALANRAGNLVVYGPNGIEAGRKRFEKSEQSGAIDFGFALPKAAARGEWRIAAEIDALGEVGSARFAVEDFVPQRIDLDLNVDTTTAIAAGETRPIEATVRFLYGAPGAGLPVEGDARIEVDPNPFPDLAGFLFGRHDETFREESFDLADTAADGSGRAVIALNPSESGAQSSRPLRARVVIGAIEPGGRAVRDDVRIAYRPNERYLGLKPGFEYGSAAEGKPATFELALADRAGALKAAQVNWRLVRIDWDYDWYREGGGEWQWRRTREVVEIQQGQSRMADGQRGAISTRELDWGDYELYLTDSRTGAEASYAFWVGWGGQPVDGVEAPDRVRLSVPETLPAVGGQVDIGIISPYDGEAEIVVASENVITTRSIRVKRADGDNPGTRIKLPVTADWGGGVYVLASVYTPRDPVERPRPRRAVGVAHVAVDVAPRTFQLTLKAPQLQAPRSQLAIDIEAKGPIRENTYVTLAAVDEGILLLTGFESPDPVKFFFGKRRLGVDIRDDYGRLLDPNQGAAAEVRSGGDQIGGAGLTVVPTKTVALYSGPVKLDRNGKGRITLDVPDFNGELRLMAVAWSESGLGSASQPLTVRDAVPSELILPRFLAPGDQAMATATLDNVDGASGAYRAQLSATGTVNVQTRDLSATLAAGQRRDIRAEISTASEGISEITMQVSGPGNFAVTHTYPIQTRSAWLPTSYVRREVIAPGATFTPAADSLASFVPGSGALQVSFSPIPMDAAALFESLERYPYGCTEQTVSRALPLLYMDQIAALAGRKTPGDLKTTIQDAVTTILNRQGVDGSIGLWRVGDRDATPWLGAYAVDFLARAKAAGYVVPDAAMDRAYDALEEFAIRDNPYASGYNFEVYPYIGNRDTEELLKDRATAYAAYVLARANRMDKARLRYLHDQRLDNIPSPLARAHIGAALQMIGDRARSTSAFDKAERALGYRNLDDYYQTERRDLAGVLALAAEAGAQNRLQRLTNRLGQDLPEPDRLTTQEKAFLLLAANALTGGSSEVKVNVAGEVTSLTANRVFRVNAAGLVRPPVFTNASTSQLWVTAISRGSPTSAPPPVSDGVTLNKQLWTTTGAAVDGTSFRQGDRLIVAISAVSSETREVPLVIADLLPAGFEIEAVLRPEDGGDTGAYGSFLGQIDAPDIAEARDDRFVAAIDLYDRQSRTVAYIVRAVTPGTFTMPGAAAEDMYRPDTFARTASRTITIAPRS